MSRIKEYPSITSFDGTNDALAIEQTDGASNRTRKVTPAQLKQYMEAGDFEATGEVEDGHGNILKDMAKSADVDTQISQLNDKFKRLNNIKIIDENFEIRFIGFSDVANRILCPIFFPFAFANNDYTLECTLLDLASVGSFTTGISVSGKDRSSALIILSKTSSAGAVYCGIANIHISRTE